MEDGGILSTWPAPDREYEVVSARGDRSSTEYSVPDLPNSCCILADRRDCVESVFLNLHVPSFILDQDRHRSFTATHRCFRY